MAISIDINHFSFTGAAAAATGKHAFFLEVGGGGGNSGGEGQAAGFPLLVANGLKPGKTLVVLAAVHGDELEGVQAIYEVFNDLDTDEMNGRFIAVPIANLAAFRAVQRNSPVDGLNLARVFPGNKNGTLTERVAHFLGELVIPQADLFLDLHSSGVAYLMPMMAGYDASLSPAGKRSREAALHFGAPLIWGHHEIGPGRTLDAAARRGIPWLYVESPSGGRVSATDLPYYINGMLNLLAHLKIVRREINRAEPKFRLLGSGDVDRTQTVNTSGFFVQKVKLLEQVEKGRLVGIVRDLFGETIEEIRTEKAGLVAMLRASPPVVPGTPVCLVAESEDGFQAEQVLKEV